jgi:hypothetical protein
LHILFWKGPVDQSKVFIMVATYSGRYQLQKSSIIIMLPLGIIEQQAAAHLFWEVPLNFENPIPTWHYVDYSAALVPYRINTNDRTVS